MIKRNTYCVAVILFEGQVLDVLTPDINNCIARETGEICGGCDRCILMQAEYYMYPILYMYVDGMTSAANLKDYLIKRSRYYDV